MNPPRTLLAVRLLAAAAIATSLADAQTTCPLLGIDSATTTTSTLWDINPVTGAASNPRTVSGGVNRPPLAIDFSPAGVLYGVSLGPPGGSPNSGMLFTIDPTTGATTFVANLTQFLNVEGDIAFDPTTGVLYGVDGIGPVFTIDTSTGVCTTIGTLPLDLPGGADYSGCGFDASGQLWVWSQFGQVLRRVNKANAAVLGTVSLAPLPGGQVGDVTFDPGSGRCFLGANPSGAILSSVNVNTGVVTPIGPTTGMAGCWSMTFDVRNCARVGIQGKGCTTRYASFYEQQFPISQDLSGWKVVGTFTGTNYVITTVPGAGFTVPPGIPPVPLGDDTSAAVGTLGFVVGSNGWLALGGSNTTAPVPNIAAFLNQPNPWLCAWTDLDPSSTAGGQVYYDEPTPTTGQATWDRVFGKGTTGLNNIQITWDLATRNWTIEFGAIALSNPQAWLTGWSPAGPSADPGPSDISTFGGSPLTLDLVDSLPLALAAIGRPLQTVLASPFQAVTTDVEPTALLHLGILGVARPGIPLNFLGLPNDCLLHASPDVFVGPHLFPYPTLTWTVLTLPALPPSFSGFVFNCQSATFDTSGIGATTRVSNGLKCVVGTL